MVTGDTEGRLDMSEESRLPGHEGSGDRVLRPLTRERGMRLLGSVPMGRIAYTSRAMPAIRPVNHMVDDDGRIIIRSHEGGSIVTATDAKRGTVVSYEADQIDASARTGWTVFVTGLARLVDDPDEAAAYRRALPSWVGGLDYIISIDPTMVAAYELVRSPSVLSV